MGKQIKECIESAIVFSLSIIRTIEYDNGDSEWIELGSRKLQKKDIVWWIMEKKVGRRCKEEGEVRRN